MNFRLFSAALLLPAFLMNIANAQLVVSTNMTPSQLVNNILVGTGVTVTNVTSTGASYAIGSFAGGIMTNLGLNNGIIMSTGDLTAAPPPGAPVTSFASTANNMPGDYLLDGLIPGYSTNDAIILEFDFIPESDTIKFRYVFGSEEYPEWVNSNYNDVFGFFVSGPNPLGGQYINENIALIPFTTVPVAINNVNNVTPSYPMFYVDNQGLGGQSIVYDGFTTVLTAWKLVTPCQTYHIKIAIADAGDEVYDSAVFLEANSFTSSSISVTTNYTNPVVNIPAAIEGCKDAIITFTLPAPRYDTAKINIDSIWGSATNGEDYSFISNTVNVIPGYMSGQLVIHPILDTIPEGIEYVYVAVQTSLCHQYDTVLIIPIYDYSPVKLNVCNDTVICQTYANLNVTASGGAPPYTYSWTPSTGLSDPLIPGPVASPSATTQYFVEVNDTTGCSFGRDSVLVRVSQVPLISFMANPYNGCDSLQVEFTSNITDPVISHYVWDLGDGFTDTLPNPAHTYHYDPNVSAYNIGLTATSVDGCWATYSVNNLIRVYPNPEADFDANPDSASISNPLIRFTDMSTIGVTTWFWDFGDGSTSDQQNPEHTYTTTDTFEVKLVVATAYGCKDSVYYKVRIIDDVKDSLDIPNVFTPNGDGKNDLFFIKALDVRPRYYVTRNLMVYNRWGKKVYESDFYNNGWDGHGLADGVYYFIFKYTFQFLGNNKERQISGSVTILR